MSKNESEKTVTDINVNIFFKEFTFNKNEFTPSKGINLELADNIIWIDNLVFALQVKERDLAKATTGDINTWFKNKVLKSAKDQIKNTVDYFNTYDVIPIKNVRNQVFDVSKIDISNMNKLIIYKCDEVLNENNRNKKFYKSEEKGYIHIINIDDYFNICKILITPIELDRYLKFRENFYKFHNEEVSIYPEQYFLAHFLNTENDFEIKPIYIESLPKFKDDTKRFDISDIIENFKDRIISSSGSRYHVLLSELVKLDRESLEQFKIRYFSALTNVKNHEKNALNIPYRFTSTNECGFVFIPFYHSNLNGFERILLGFTEIYKYKHKLTKCIGVILFKENNDININWTFFNKKWEYNKELENLVALENKEFTSNVKIVKPNRYLI